MESGLPSFRPPPFESRVGNETYNFVEMASKLGSGILVVPLLSILENISLAKFFCELILRLKMRVGRCVYFFVSLIAAELKVQCLLIIVMSVFDITI